VARGQGAAARAIEKEGLVRWCVAFPSPFCYTDLNLSVDSNQLQHISRFTRQSAAQKKLSRSQPLHEPTGCANHIAKWNI
jgi:hypothetical protein